MQFKDRLPCMDTKKEIECLTRAYVAMASNAYLTKDEKQTLRHFRDAWFSGNEFEYREDKIGTYRRFFSICSKYKIGMPIMRRPRVPRGEKAGAFYPSEMTVKPDRDGACWPAYDSNQSREHRQKLKRDHRNKVMHLAMAEFGV